MIDSLAVGYLVASALDRGESCPADTSEAIRMALLGICPAGCSCEARVERRRLSSPPPGMVERRRAATASRGKIAP